MCDYYKIARANISLLESEYEIGQYLAFLFSELARLDSEWAENLNRESNLLESE